MYASRYIGRSWPRSERKPGWRLVKALNEIRMGREFDASLAVDDVLERLDAHEGSSYVRLQYTAQSLIENS